VWSKDCCILNGGDGAWVFDDFAHKLSQTLCLDVSETPREYNYLLSIDDVKNVDDIKLFIPFSSMEIASDKRFLAEAFFAKSVPIPITKLVNSLDEAEQICLDLNHLEWCLKYPIGCGGTGHLLYEPGMSLPRHWPYPLILQEFIRLDCPEVFRLYCACNQLFGWVSRRFPKGAKTSPWVAHARGARYELAGIAPSEALNAARAAFEAVGLINSFGCVDLLLRPGGEWVVLEVGTDGIFNHVDRDLGLTNIENEIQSRVAQAFWSRVSFCL
jgi:hypothetical protein